MSIYNINRRTTMKLAGAGALVGLLGARAGADEVVALDFWDMIWGPPEYAVTAQKLVDQYNAGNPGVKVTYRSVPWGNWYETFVTAIASGSPPDVSGGAAYQAVHFYGQGAVMPVDEVIEEMRADGTLADFLPGTLEAMQYDGHYVGIPTGIGIRAMYYRKDVLERAGVAPPATWDEFRAAAKAVTGNGRYGVVSHVSGWAWILTFAINNGGGLFDKDGKPNITGERTSEAVRFLASLVEDGSVNPASVGYSSDDSVASFLRGDAAFILMDNGLTGRADAATKDLIGMLPPLTGPHGSKGTISWIDNVMVYSATKHPKETFAFAKWWAANRGPVWTDGHAGAMPATASQAALPYVQAQPHVQFSIENYLPVAKTTSAELGGTFPALNEIEGDGFLSAFVQQLWQGQPPDEIMATAQAHLIEIMEK